MYRFYICYFIQESIETVVLEEHQSEVVVDPPLTSQQVRLCIAFFVRLCMDFSDLVLSLCMDFSNLVVSLCTFLYIYVSL